jgi:hypothetical protein
MSRSHITLNDSAYRGVILRRIVGATGLELKRYLRSDGVMIDYHTSIVIGPYSTRGAAQGQVTYNARYLDDPTNFDAFVERVPATGWEVC